MKKIYLILLIIFFICYNSYGQLNEKKLVENELSTELNLKNITLLEAMTLLSKKTNVTIIPEEEIKSLPLNLYFTKGENFEDILNSITKLYNLKVLKVGKIFLLMKKENSFDKEKTFFGKITSKVNNLPLDNVKITLINSCFSPVYSIHGGNFIISGVEPGVYLAKFEKSGYVTKGDIINLKDKDNFINISLEKESIWSNSTIKKISNSKNNISMDSNEIVTEYIHLYNSQCDTIKKVLADLIPNEKLNLSEILDKNILIISGTRKYIQNAKEIIENLDREKEQIRISSEILDVTDNLFESLGFNWIYANNENSDFENDWSISILGNNSLQGIGTTYNSTLSITKQFNSGNDILNLGINLLKNTQDLVVSARPSILVLDGEEGVFKVTEEVIVGEKKEENSNNDKINYTPIFKEAGIILKVTPYIKNNNCITLKVIIEVSNFKLKVDKNEKSQGGTYNSEGGSKIGRSIETIVRLKDGETIFIGGLKKSIIRNIDSEVPFFATLPMINFFFKNKNISHETTDIYIKLKVNIVKNNFETNDTDSIYKKIANKKIY